MKTSKLKIGFIGQGYIGKNYADAFEENKFSVVRYALEEPYKHNKEKIQDCDIVFIAVPTPTTPKGFDASIVEGALSLVRKGAIAVIKSTILPGTTERFQKKYPNLILIYSPEFLSESTAAHDARHPFSNIVGIAASTVHHKKAAVLLHSILPKAPYALTCNSTEAELVKYTHNGSGYVQIIFFNLMYDLAQSLGVDWDTVQEAIVHDPLVSNRYSKPLHKSGRGAGGHCFIKDFAALRELYTKKNSKDKAGQNVMQALERKNINLLLKTKKDKDLLEGVYGKKVSNKG
jgi:nucleotide sugar dehydrogenase